MASQGAASCDREEQAVRAEALSALIRTNPEDMSTLMRSVLARKDECSIQLRKTAVYLVGNKRDAQSGAVLINVARTDPSIDVRVDAINWLGRIASDEALSTLGDLTKAEEDERIQRAAVRALVNHPNARAREQVRSLVERADAPERLRTEALSAFTSERATTDDIAWLRGVYTRLDNPRLKRSALAAIVRISGSDTDQWLMTIVRNEEEPSELRATALRRIGQTLSIADLGRMYESASSRSLREQLVNIFGQRKEPEATDKLIEIAKTGTDPNLRTRALNVLTEKNDPRTRALLLELINK
jgi:HEAT repeat protein